MMFSKAESGKNTGEDSSNGKLLNEIEAIRKALYMDINRPKSFNSSSSTRSKSTGKTQLPDAKLKLKNANEDAQRKEKKTLWGWKTLKAFSHIRHRRFNCCFSLHVHSIERMPLEFNGVSLCVYWKRQDGTLVTRPAKVVQGIVDFEEQLTYTCSVYGSRSGPNHLAKYEAKHFLLYASIYGAPELDLGKHRIELTRFLPVTLEDLEGGKSSGEWSTSFKLSGRAKSATMHVSFGYAVVGDNSIALGNQQIGLSKTKQDSRNTGKSGPDRKSSIRRAESLPSESKHQFLTSSQSVDDIKDLHEVLPISQSELASSVVMLYKKFDEDKLETSVDYKPELDVFIEHVEPIKPNSSPLSGPGIEFTDDAREEFSVTEQGVEVSLKEEDEEIDQKAVDVFSCTRLDFEKEKNLPVACEEGGNLDCNDEVHDNCRDNLVVHDDSSDKFDICTKESLMKELESALHCVSDLEIAALESPEDQDDDMEIKSEYTTTMGKSINSDDDLVATEFLDMLGIEHSPFNLSSESEPESPRERLLRQFEKEALAGHFSLFDSDMHIEAQSEYDNSGAAGGSEWGNIAYDFDLSSAVHAAEEIYQMETKAGSSKMKAKTLEDMETEALMHEWGLNESTFQNSPPDHSCGFGSPIDLPQEAPVQLPCLDEGLGPFLQTKDGGFLRSMNPSVFKNAKSGGSLIMQVSSPVVVPAEMGSGIMEILQRLASVGIEKLSMQASKLMPLEDVTGKTMQQVAWEAAPTLEGPDRQCLPQHDFVVGQGTTAGHRKYKGRSSGPGTNEVSSNLLGSEIGSEYVSLEDLAPLAMDKIEALSMEGLRIQSGMSDVDAPSNISAQSIGEFSALKGKGINITGSLGLEGTAGLQLLDIKDGNDDVDGLMGLSLTLDEWMRLDSGELDDEEYISERTSKILAAHHANSLDMIRNGTKGERKRGKRSGRKCGLLGNNFTVALMVQLRDPLRDYEPVGAPMLSLIQVERVFIPPKPRIYSKVSEIKNNSETEDDDESVSFIKKEPKEEAKEERASEEEGIPQFRITEVHVAGIKTDPVKKLWGNSNQQKSGSRWLLANGMGKNNKHPFMKSKAAPAKPTTTETMKVQPGDTLWSISSRVHGNGAKWKDLAALNPHIRNPNVIFPNETIRLR